MRHKKTIRWLSVGVLIGPILFTLAWFILGFVSTGFTIYGVTVSPYIPISAQISALGLGPTGIYMNAAFILTGVLMLVGLIGIFWKMDELNNRTPWIALALLALTPLAAILDGFFTINSGFIHYGISMLAFFVPVISFLVTGLLLRKIPSWKYLGRWLIVASPITLILIILFFITFIPTPQGQKAGVGGLVERVLVTEIFFWYAAIGWTKIRSLSGTKNSSIQELKSKQST